MTVFIFIKNPKSLINRVGSAIFICFAIWSFTMVFIHNHYTSLNTAILFNNIASFGTTGLYSFLLWFFLIFSEKKKILKSKLFYFFIFFIPLLFIFVQWKNCLIIRIEDYNKIYGWQTTFSVSIWRYLFHVYIFSIIGIVLYLIFICINKAKDYIKKKQSKIIFATLLITVILGTLADVILPPLGVILPNLSNVFAIIWAFGIFYAITKYKLFVLTPYTAADNIIRTMSDSLLMLDFEGKIINANSATLNLLGYDEKDIINQPVDILFAKEKITDPPAKIPTSREAGELILIDSVSSNIEQTFLSKDGCKIPVLFSSSVVRDTDGNIQGIVCIAKDITEQKKAGENIIKSEERFRRLFEQSNDAIFIHALNGIILDVNSQACEMLGYTREQIISKPIQDFYPKKNYLDYIKIINIVKEREAVRLESQFRKADGTIIDVDIISRIIDHEKGVVQGIARDISQSKKIEQKLIKAKEKAEEADRLKSAFLANMSHEIRTPMNAIIGFVDLLNKPDLSAEKRKEFLDIINNNCDILLKLIDDIIDIAKIEANQISIEIAECNLDILFLELFTYYEDSKTRKRKEHIELRLKKPEGVHENTILTEPVRLRQVLSNLISNALKFTDSGFIELGYTLKNSKILQFYVKDTGIGIQKELQDLIFDRFRQADDSSTKKISGAGLGLALSKGLVKLLGGEIWVESTPGKGSTFYFTLPYMPSSETVTDTPDKFETKEKYDWNDKVILIVEDEDTNYKFIEEALQETDAQLIHAKNGKQAIELCKANKNINIVLMDIQLPELDGYTATQQIKQFRKELPVIAQTAYALTDEKDKCLKAGCIDYLAKPYIASKLLAMISKYI